RAEDQGQSLEVHQQIEAMRRRSYQQRTHFLILLRHFQIEEPPSTMPKVCRTATKDKKEKVGLDRRQLLLGDSIIRGVELESSGLVRCLPGATARRDKRRILNIVKQAKQQGEVDVLVHLGTNDLASNEVSEIKEDFCVLGGEIQQIASTVSFSDVLPVHNIQDRQMRNREFNLWLREWCREQGFGFVSHDSSNWSRKELYKKDGLHLTHMGTYWRLLRHGSVRKITGT
uniref:SGNH hydrolase-type esterase domain-containing protein n=1 Tax=Leptobrachium leishanense TaxID=445787 RepID=A0A8C5PB88_9ANUR